MAPQLRRSARNRATIALPTATLPGISRSPTAAPRGIVLYCIKPRPGCLATAFCQAPPVASCIGAPIRAAPIRPALPILIRRTKYQVCVPDAAVECELCLVLMGRGKVHTLSLQSVGWAA